MKQIMCERLCSFYIIIHSSGGWTGTLSSKCKLNMLILQTGWPTYHLTSRRKSAVIASTLIVFSRTFFCPFFKFVCFSFFVVRYKNTFLRERGKEREGERAREDMASCIFIRVVFSLIRYHGGFVFLVLTFFVQFHVLHVISQFFLINKS